jgi:hypothetical protein
LYQGDMPMPMSILDGTFDDTSDGTFDDTFDGTLEGTFVMGPAPQYNADTSRRKAVGPTAFGPPNRYPATVVAQRRRRDNISQKKRRDKNKQHLAGLVCANAQLTASVAAATVAHAAAMRHQQQEMQHQAAIMGHAFQQHEHVVDGMKKQHELSLSFANQQSVLHNQQNDLFTSSAKGIIGKALAAMTAPPPMPMTMSMPMAPQPPPLPVTAPLPHAIAPALDVEVTPMVYTIAFLDEDGVVVGDGKLGETTIRGAHVPVTEKEAAEIFEGTDRFQVGGDACCIVFICKCLTSFGVCSLCAERRMHIVDE